MKSRVGMALLGCLLVVVLLTACVRVPAASSKQSGIELAEPAVLIEKANTLAKSELSKLAAAEMVYRHKVLIHAYELSQAEGQPTRLYMKLFRSFTGFEVVDIERSASIIMPLKITIRFNFDRIGTRPVGGGIGNVELANQVAKDFVLVVLDSKSIVREYLCSAQGDVIKSPDPILDRPIYWSKDPNMPYGSTWLEDPLAPPGS